MDRIAAALLIAVAALVFNSGMLGNAQAEDVSVRIKLETAQRAAQAPSCDSRGGRVMSLLLCLKALQEAPGLLDRPKV